MAKYASASKCDLIGFKCSICEFAKGHQQSTKASLNKKHSSDLDGTIGALKITHLKPGVQVSVDHFESRILGRTFD